MASPETRRTVAEALARCDLQQHELVSRLRAARWSVTRLADEIQVLGWLERLAQDVEHFTGPDRVRVALSGGPVALADHDDATLLPRIKDPTLRSFAEQFRFGRGALLVGPTGAGKTVAGFVAARRMVLRTTELTDNGSPVIVWAKALDLGTARAQHRLGAHEAPLIEAAKQARFLVIDDLAYETDSSAIVDVLAQRYDSGAHTLVTTAFDLARLQAKYGAPTLRKLLETGGHEGVIVTVPDRDQEPKTEPSEGW